MQNTMSDDLVMKAQTTARRIMSGDLSPFDGAMQIWKEIVDPLEGPCPDTLWPFKSNAGAIEDIRWNAEMDGERNDALLLRCEEEILAAAKALLAVGMRQS